MSNIPADLKYAKSHEWVRVSGGVATVGISDHAQHELTDVVFVELPEVGKKVKAAVDDPALVNTEPYAGGWFYKIKLSNPAELNALLTPEQYGQQVGG